MLDDYPPDTPPWAEDEEVTQLVHEIELASDLYYNTGRSTLSDDADGNPSMPWVEW